MRPPFYMIEPRPLPPGLVGGSLHRSSSFILSDSADASPQLPDDLRRHRERLRIGFEFSRSFILTYQAAIVGVLLVVTAWQVYHKWARRRQRRCRTKRKTNVGKHGTATAGRSGSHSPASSSTGKRREGQSASPVSSVYDEQSPLLATDSTQETGIGLMSTIQSVLVHQPAPLPFFNRTMPSNGASLFISALLGLNLFYLFYRIDGPDALSDRASLLFVANLPWLYLLAAKNQPVRLMTGHSYENLNILHRRLGEWMCALAVIHAVGMLVAWYQFLRPLGVELIRFLTLRYIVFGIAAFFCYELLLVTSLSSFRRYWYEMFLGSHILLQIAGLVLLFLHHFRGRPYVLISLVIFLVDRLVLRLGMKFRSFNAELEVLADGDTVLVSADWPIRNLWSTSCIPSARRGMEQGWQPTEHVFISVPCLGMKHRFQLHPITIASAAPTPEASHAWFNLLIRAKDGFSKDLLHYAQNNRAARIWLDGPYGSSHALEMLHARDAAVVVAGGSGIAVAYPLLWSLLHAPINSEAATAKQSVCLVWVVQDAQHLAWIGHERLDELRELGLEVVIPPPTQKQGRPDVAGMLQTYVEDVSRAMDSQAGIGVVVSGPDGLNRSVRNACAQMIRRGIDIEVAVEKFGW